MFLVFVVISLIEIISRKKFEKKSIMLEKVLLGSGLTVFVGYFAFRAFQMYQYFNS
jgi:Ca2+/Na+ antiporter